MRWFLMATFLAGGLALSGLSSGCQPTHQQPDAGPPGIQGDTGKKWWEFPDARSTPDAGGSPGVDKACYDACIQKGQSDAACVKACSKTPPKTGAPVPGTKSCYDECIKLPKDPGPEACKKYCDGPTGTPCKSDADCARSPKTPVCDTAKGLCIEAGITPQRKCDFNAPCPCYEDCIKAGKEPGECEPKCYPGGAGIKDREAEACYDRCVKKDGGNKHSCYPKCYPLQACKEPCLKAGKGPDACQAQCTQDCLRLCTQAGESPDACKRRCPDLPAPAPCMETCTKAGSATSYCTIGCACYDPCVKAGRPPALCQRDCFEGCERICINGGSEPATCKRGCACFGDCTQAGGDPQRCRARCFSGSREPAPEPPRESPPAEPLAEPTPDAGTP